MIKKALFGVGLALLIPILIFGRDAGSYVKTAGESVRKAVKNEVPPEFEVQRIKEIVDQLAPEIRQCMHVIAEQQVDVEHLNTQIADRERNLADQEKILLSMTNDVESGRNDIRYASHTYTNEEVQRDLAIRFEKFKVAREALERDRKILKARDKALQANHKKLDEMISQKQELEVKVAELESRLQSIRAASTVSELAFDDSKLSQAKQAIRDLNKSLDVRERMLDVESKFVDLIPTEDVRPLPENLSAQVRNYLGRETAAESVSEEALVRRSFDE
jgi:predicted  nucleic acid-binding Zn-ribbon protein